MAALRVGFIGNGPQARQGGPDGLRHGPQARRGVPRPARRRGGAGRLLRPVSRAGRELRRALRHPGRGRLHGLSRDDGGREAGHREHRDLAGQSRGAGGGHGEVQADGHLLREADGLHVARLQADGGRVRRVRRGAGLPPSASLRQAVPHRAKAHRGRGDRQAAARGVRLGGPLRVRLAQLQPVGLPGRVHQGQVGDGADRLQPVEGGLRHAQRELGPGVLGIRERRAGFRRDRPMRRSSSTATTARSARTA